CTSAGLMRESEGNDGHESERVTRILFCGPYFAASHVYTREYVSQFPYIKVNYGIHSDTVHVNLENWSNSM
ncbi:hypothetical protein ACP3WY_25480, partial [Salmonella enterica]|uniref:hypothetical protein n=1 Tax=Salmonella enterica TaxID=28901 RepID=UPI003CF3DB40